MKRGCRIASGRLLAGLLFLFLCLRLAGEEWLPESRGKVVRHTYYVLDFNDEHHQANWVYYEMSPERLVKRASRKDDFRTDPAVGEACATLADYRKSGYDRGHLCPAADMAFDERAMSETFYLSNMTPQTHACNAGIWSRLEAHVRERARKERLYVVTGPVFKDVHGAIGENEVTVPGYFYKLFYSPSRQQMVAYVVPNKASRQTLASFAVPVDKVERITGIDFFPGLPDELERIVEADTLSHAGDPYITALLDAVAGKESGGNPAEEKVRRPESGDNRSAAADKTAGTSSDSRRYVPSAREQVILVLSVLLLFGMWRIFVYRGKKAGKKSRSRSRRSPSRSRRK